MPAGGTASIQNNYRLTRRGPDILHHWIDVPYEESVAGFDPRTLADEYVCLRITPRSIQAWREVNELAGRWLMHEGSGSTSARDRPGWPAGPVKKN